MHYVLFILLTLAQAYDEPETLNHVKFEFFYKAQFVPQEVSERPKLPLNSLMPVIIPTTEYHIIQRANVEQGDLDYLIWFFNYQEHNDLEAMAWHRKLLQTGQFNTPNLLLFKEAVANMIPHPRHDLMLLVDMTIFKMKEIFYRQYDSSDSDSSWGDDFL